MVMAIGFSQNVLDASWGIYSNSVTGVCFCLLHSSVHSISLSPHSSLLVKFISFKSYTIRNLKEVNSASVFEISTNYNHRKN